MLYPEIAKQLERDEGRRNRGYQDTMGHWTIGVGHNVESGPALPNSAIDIILENDIRLVIQDINHFIPWARQLDVVRHGALVNLVFNMGIYKVMEFHNTLRALREGRYKDAARGVLNSKYATQVGARADRVADQIELGIWV